MTPEEEARTNLYKNMFVSHEQMDQILDRHGDRVVKQLKPELNSINKELKRGYETFGKHEDEIDQLKVDLEAHKASPHPTTSQNPETPPSPPKEDEATGISRKAKIIIAIIAAVFAVVGAFILGFFYLASLFPW